MCISGEAAGFHSLWYSHVLIGQWFVVTVWLLLPPLYYPYAYNISLQNTPNI